MHHITILYVIYNKKSYATPVLEVIKHFSCSTQLNMTFSLLINMKKTTSYLLAEKFSCSAMFSEKKLQLLVI